MPIPRSEPQEARVIAHVDMDCFYVQVEQRRQPELRGRPTAVVQYNSWQGGGLIAVSYEARKFGVKRSMRGDEAKRVCPDIQLIQVPVARGKANLNDYRNAGSEVVSILATEGRCERASIDEVYLDLTDAAEQMLSETSPEIMEAVDEAVKSHILGLADNGENSVERAKAWLCRPDACHRDKLLACGAMIVAQLRLKVLKVTEFTCSAGIAHNKILAKLASALHKPAQQTVVPASSVNDLLASLPVKKMKQLGGKLGTSLQNDLQVSTVGDLLQFPLEKLQDRYGINTGLWLWNIARGISGEEVAGRLLPKSHGCGKTFPGPRALKSMASVEYWLGQLSEELNERVQTDLDQNKRVAHTLTLHAGVFMRGNMESQRKFPSKSCPLRYGASKLKEDATKLFDSALREFIGSESDGWRVNSLSVTASKILDTPPGTCLILNFFGGKDSSISPSGTFGFNEDDNSLSRSGNGSDIKQVDDVKHVAHFCTSLNNGSCKRDNGLHDVETVIDKPKEKEYCTISRYLFGKYSKTQASVQADVPASTTAEANGTRTTLDATKQQIFCAPEKVCGVSCNGIVSPNQTTSRSVWSFNVEDIDPSVVDELPLEIQAEVRALNSFGGIGSISPNGTSGFNEEGNGSDIKKVDDVKHGARFCTNLNYGSCKQDNGLHDVETVIDKPKEKESWNISRYFSRNSLKKKASLQADMPASTSVEAHGTRKALDATQQQIFCASGEGCSSNGEGIVGPNQTTSRSHSWSINVDDIDPSVVDELPPEIQAEVKGWLHTAKQAKVGERRRGITQYFLPTKEAKRR